MVLVGIKLGIGQPYSDNPDKGILTVNSELTPIASPYFEQGPPKEESIELSRVIDRGIRESGAIDMSKLYIEENKVWMVFVDIDVLNHDGNLIDCSALGAIASLLNAYIPKFEDNEIIYGEKAEMLPVNKKPIAITVSKIGEKFLLDLCVQEEKIMNSRLTVTTLDDDNVCSLQKGGSSGFSADCVDKILEISKNKAKEFRKLL